MLKNKEKLLFTLPLIFPILAAIFSLVKYQAGLELILREDKILESMSFFVWIGLCITFIRYSLKQKDKKFLLICYFIAGLLSLGIAMEEISWGQRIFNIETPAKLAQINAQKELNLHNIKIGDVKINRIILQKIAPIFLVFYFIALPIAFRKERKWAKNIVDFFRIPVFPLKYLWIILLYVTITFTIVEHRRHGELAEFFLPYIVLILFVKKSSL